jgi:hypothetical protein
VVICALEGLLHEAVATGAGAVNERLDATEIAVREVVAGRPVKNQEALANPEALDLFKGLEELRS